MANFIDMTPYIYINNSWKKVTPVVCTSIEDENITWKNTIVKINSPLDIINSNHIKTQLKNLDTKKEYLSISAFNSVDNGPDDMSSAGLFLWSDCIGTESALNISGYEGQLIFIYDSTN